MLRVEITQEAKLILERQLAEALLVEPGVYGLYIYQQLHTADVFRGDDGGVIWKIDRAEAWCINVIPIRKIPRDDIIEMEGFSVHLGIIGPTAAMGLIVKAKNGKVFVERL